MARDLDYSCFGKPMSHLVELIMAINHTYFCTQHQKNDNVTGDLGAWLAGISVTGAKGQQVLIFSGGHCLHALGSTLGWSYYSWCCLVFHRRWWKSSSFHVILLLLIIGLLWIGHHSLVFCGLWLQSFSGMNYAECISHCSMMFYSVLVVCIISP